MFSDAERRSILKNKDIFRIEGVILVSKEAHEKILDRHPKDPCGAFGFSGVQMTVYVKSKPESCEKMIELLMENMRINMIKSPLALS